LPKQERKKVRTKGTNACTKANKDVSKKRGERGIIGPNLPKHRVEGNQSRQRGLSVREAIYDTFLMKQAKKRRRTQIVR